MTPPYIGRSALCIVSIGAMLVIAPSVHASACTSAAPTVTITSPNDGYTTTDATVDVKGTVSGICALADLSCGTSAERTTVRSQLAPATDRAWDFECAGVELDLADTDQTLLNQIPVAASGFAAGGGPVSADDTILVTHTGPPGVDPPGDDGFPVNDAYTKSKVTWNHRYPDYDAFSTNARLGYPGGNPLPMPCAVGDSITLTLYADGVDQPLYTDTVAGDWGVCTDTRVRKTGPRGGIREISFDRRSDGDDTFYVYWEQVEYGPSDFALVRSIEHYLLHITMSTSGQTAEWLVDIGPVLNYEEFYLGSGEEARTVVRLNR
jgi:hypothetical protein